MASSSSPRICAAEARCHSSVASSFSISSIPLAPLARTIHSVATFSGIMAPSSTEGLHVHVFATAAQAISAAASAVALELRRLIRERGRAVGIFDGALLPEEFFAALTAEPELDWTQVIVFQAAEFLGTDDLRRFL